MDDEAIDEAVIGMMKTLIKKRLTTDMLSLVDELAKVFSHSYDKREREAESVTTSDMFPVQAGRFF